MEEGSEQIASDIEFSLSPQPMQKTAKLLHLSQGNDNNMIVDVWADNFLQELAYISELLQNYNYVAMVSNDWFPVTAVVSCSDLWSVEIAVFLNCLLSLWPCS